jgi:hypothetical protein
LFFQINQIPKQAVILLIRYGGLRCDMVGVIMPVDFGGQIVYGLAAPWTVFSYWLFGAALV